MQFSVTLKDITIGFHKDSIDGKVLINLCFTYYYTTPHLLHRHNIVLLSIAFVVYLVTNVDLKGMI